MTDPSKAMVYLFVGLPAIVVLVLLLLAGPLGWFCAVFVGISIMIIQSVSDDESESPPMKRNCSVCGSLNETSRETCKYCDKPL